MLGFVHPSHQRPRSTSSTHGPPSTPRSHDTRSPTPSGSYLTVLGHHIALRTALRRTTALAQPCRFGASDSCADPAGDRTQIIQIWRARVRRRSGSSSRRFGRQTPGQGPWPGNPRPAVTASAGQCDWGPWAAPSGDPGTPRPPWAANPGVFSAYIRN
jgi:hypothetical protein